MGRIAQIQDERAQWVFEAEKLFPHASYIEIPDVTDVVPQMQKGGSTIGRIAPLHPMRLLLQH